MPITEETDTQRPLSPYGNSKKIAEEILEDFVKVNPIFSVVTMRYFNPIGAHESGKIGELPKGVPNNLIPYITQTAAGKREKLMVYGNDYPTKDGTAIRDYIHVVDLANAHVKAVQRLHKNQQDNSFEIYNLGSGNGFSVMEVIKTFERVAKMNLNYEVTDRREGDVPELYTTTDLAFQKLGWKAKRGLDEMIYSAWQWQSRL